MKHHLAFTIVLNALLVWQNGLAAEDTRHEADVCVYGGTASGVMAALAAEKEGAKVILIEPSRWLGGMTGGGINHLDWGKGNTVGGSTYKILMEGLEKQVRGHRGNAIVGIGHKRYRERFKKAVEDRGITVIYDHRLGKVDLEDSTIDSPTRQRPIALHESIPENKEGSSIRSITLDFAPVDETGCPIPEPKKHDAVTVAAKVFIDCSYEGDLLAMSGVNYTWGRESRQHYNESLAGVRPSLWVHDIDPYIEPGNPESGLVPFVQDRKIGPLGSADSLTMGYCYRYDFDMSGQQKRGQDKLFDISSSFLADALAPRSFFAFSRPSLIVLLTALRTPMCKVMSIDGLSLRRVPPPFSDRIGPRLQQAQLRIHLFKGARIAQPQQCKFDSGIGGDP